MTANVCIMLEDASVLEKEKTWNRSEHMLSYN